MFNLFLIDIRLGNHEPSEMSGFATVRADKIAYIPTELFPIEGDEIPAGYSGWLVFMDELTSATPVMQSAAYRVILDRLVGNKKLHKNVAIMGAGNLETDGAVVFPMSSALKSRMVHLEAYVDDKEFIHTAETLLNFDYRITSYLNFRPDHVYTFDPEADDYNYAAPRTWEFVHNTLAVVKNLESAHLPLLGGTLGKGVSREFFAFCEVHDRLPKIEDILRTPLTAKVPDEPSVLYALAGAFSAHVTSANVSAFSEYVGRMPPEFQIVTVRSTIRRNKTLLKETPMKQWIVKFADELM